MKTSQAGIDLIKRFESCRLKAYPDPKTGSSPWTCGWGETEGVGPDTWWTQDECDRRLMASIAAREMMVSKYVTHPTTQGQFDAFVSLFYNVGPGNQYRDGIAHLHPDGRPSTLLRAFNQGDIGKCEREWLKWISPGSGVEHGLLNRRMAELALFRGEK